MSVLRTIESKIEGLFEGVFGRAFRTHVQPVELARKLAKEMDEHRSVSVSRVYVPNEYTIYLSSGDRQQFVSYEGSLVGELQEYLTEHARREAYALLTPPRVKFATDDDLAVGEFGIATRVAQPEDGLPALPTPAAPAPQSISIPVPAAPVAAAPAAAVTTTMVYGQGNANAVEAPPAAEPEPPREVVTLTLLGLELTALVVRAASYAERLRVRLTGGDVDWQAAQAVKHYRDSDADRVLSDVGVTLEAMSCS